MKKSIVIKIGGSIIYDENLDVNFRLLRKLKEWYDSSLLEYSKIVVVVGGGKLSRMIHEKVSKKIKEEEYLHQIGMSVTQISANIVAGYLDDREIYIPRKLGDAYEYLYNEEQVKMVSGGLKVGWSTDMDAVVYADILQLDRVFKISNVDYLYDFDPRKNNSARPLLDISWDEYFKLFNITNGSVHMANSNIPIDPQCAQFANIKGIGMHLTGGSRIEEIKNLTDLLQGGSYIHP